jgi:L-2-hydroxycarboxylate dehydrogenase (NAD+)
MPTFSIDELKKRLGVLFKDAGLSANDAETLAEILVWTEASGRRSHGLIRVRPMLKRLAAVGHPPGHWARQDENTALYSCQGELGYLVAHRCAEKAIELAQNSNSGISLVGAKETLHTGPIGYYAWMCAVKGIISICLANCSPMAAPYGAKSPVLGTNPITFGFPFSPEPVVVDLATTAVTYGQCKLTLAEGRELPEGLVLDKRGEPTTDPQAFMGGGALLPFGGHKGYALAVAVQILTSALIGAAAIPARQEEYGFTVIALRRDIFVGKEHFDQTVKQIADALKAAVPIDPEHPVILPGERSAANRKDAEKNGINLTQSLYDEIFGTR